MYSPMSRIATAVCVFGYAYAPGGSIMLKQANRDGTVGEVRTD